MQAVVTHKRVSIASCHGPGKDAMASWLILWAMICFPNPRIPCTAPTGHQLYDLLWAEVVKWKGKMLKGLAATIEVKKDRIENIKHPQTWYAVARTARPENSEGLQGFHEDNILVVIDEASGVHNLIFEVLEGSMTGRNAMMLLIGNPTQTQGYFYDSHHEDRARWYRMTIDYTKSPRVPREYVDSMRKKYGEESNVFRVRVLGLFPKSEDDVTIPFHWVEKAGMRELYRQESASIMIGVDVGRFGGDPSAIVVREGRNLISGDVRYGNEITKTTGWVVLTAKKLAKRLKHPDERIYICVDGVGVGAGVVDLLREILSENPSYPWIIIDVQAGARATRHDPECERRRDELWWRSREYFRVANPAIAPPKADSTDLIGFTKEMRDQLMAELSSPKYEIKTTGKVKVESKADMKKRGLESPNLGDACIHTMAFEVDKPEEKPKDGWRDDFQAIQDDWMTG